jgi:type II secretory pathway pseudopilin PulG
MMLESFWAASKSFLSSSVIPMILFSKAHPGARRAHSQREDGYVLLMLMLMVALMGIMVLVVTVPIKFELRRERETEMIHRGVQYSRAIRNYYKKFGRYPTRLEDLDNTNNLRYLRKHYKDPLTGKDFKLLHYGDPGLALTSSIGGGGIAGAVNPAQMNAAAPGNGSAFGSSSTFSNSSFGNSGVNSSGAFSQSSGFGGNSNSAFGSGVGNPSTSNNQANSGTTPNTPNNGSDPTDASAQVAPGTAQGDTSSSTQGVFGGGPIVGVASISKEQTIREYNKKKKYNEWQFVYDPTLDRGGLLTTPYQPALQIAQNPLGQNGQPANANQNGSSFGQPSGFGNGNSGFGNGGSSFGGGTTTPAQPPSSAPQQQ